ncbi:MAG: hypothetical protein HOV80_08750 [Polyangiaceae bacterium]|nr:hypothetical protein [Polyangiaceae bacterium]
MPRACRPFAARLLVLSALALLPGCVYAPVVAEPLRVENLDDLPPESLGFQPGTTTIEEARTVFESRRMSGIALARYARETGPTIEVLGADYQTRLHLFENGTYKASIQLPTAGLPPYGLAVGLGRAGDADVLLALYRDPLSRAEEPPRLLSFAISNTGVALVDRRSLGGLVSKHGGMTRPALIGNDLDTGVMLVARDAQGALWDTSYLFVFDRGRFAVRPQSMNEAMRCSCVRDYAYATEATTQKR